MGKLSSAAQHCTRDTALLQGAFAGVFTHEFDSIVPVTRLWRWYSAKLALLASDRLLSREAHCWSWEDGALCPSWQIPQ